MVSGLNVFEDGLEVENIKIKTIGKIDILKEYLLKDLK